MPTTLRADCLAAAGNTADHLLSLAKQDHHGVYWDSIPRCMSTAVNAALELSLQTGTPGILLFLCEVYRNTGDSRLRELLGRSAAWIRARSRTAPVRQGFYAGYGGSMYAAATAEVLIGVTPSAGSCDAWRGLVQTDRFQLASLADGVAGTLLGLECLHELGAKDTPMEFATEFMRILVRQTRLTPLGVYWGRHPHSSRPCVSFCHGSTGVQYLLSRYAAGSSEEAATWLAAAGLRQDNTAFDAATGNWRDFINEEYFKLPTVGKRLRQAGERDESEPFEVSGDSIGWANGTSGILLSRLAFTTHSLQSLATVDISRAIECIARAAATIGTATADFSLYNGWAGIGLAAMHAVRINDNPRLDCVVDTILAACLGQHRAHSVIKPLADGSASHLALFRGEAGTAYFLLKASADDPTPSVLAPLGITPAGRPLDLTRSAVVNAVATAALPRTCKANADLALSPPPELSLDSFLQQAQWAVRQQPEPCDDVLAYDTSLLKAEVAQSCHSFLAWKRTHKIDRFRSSRRFANDRLLLKETVSLRPDVRLGKVQSRARGSSPAATGSRPDLVLLVPEYCGIVEHALGQATYAVLSQLMRPQRVSALCRILQAKYPSLAGATGIEPVVLREVRNGLAAGALQVQGRRSLLRVLDVVFRR